MQEQQQQQQDKRIEEYYIDQMLRIVDALSCLLNNTKERKLTLRQTEFSFLLCWVLLSVKGVCACLKVF